MESHKDPSFLSLQHLLEELENLIVLESYKKDNPWISISKLSQLFHQKYGISLGKVAKAQGYSNSLKHLFASAKRFSIYGTQIPHEFYVAPLEIIDLGFKQSPSKVDRRLPKTLKKEGAEGGKPCQSQKKSEYQPIVVSELKSVDDLEFALLEIIKSLTTNHPIKNVTIASLSKSFSDYYKQPIKTVIRDICPDMKLIELLQTIPTLQVQKLENDWRITLNRQS